MWVLASAFGVPAMVMGNVEEEQEHNSKWFLMQRWVRVALGKRRLSRVNT